MLPEAAKFKKDWQKRQRSLIKSGVDCAYLYVHLEAASGEPFYVGMGDSQKRPWETNRSRKHKNRANKHGSRVEPITVSNLSYDNAQWWEIRWIKALRDAGYDLVNLTDGGEGAKGYKHTPEVCASRRGDGNCMRNPEIAAKRSGDKHHSKTIPDYVSLFETENNPAFSKEHRDFMSGPNAPMKNPEIAKKNALARTGKKRSDEQRKNISAGQQAHQDRITDEERRISTEKQIATKIKNGTLITIRTKEENIAAGQKSWETRRARGKAKPGKYNITPEAATGRANKGWETRREKGNTKSTRTSEQKTETANKIWETRRLKKLRSEQYWGA